MIGSLLDLGVGMFTDARNRKMQRRMHEQTMQAQKEQFDQQMDHSIRRRVLDARRSGIHPLFALGASVGASPTITAGQASNQTAASRAAGRLATNLAEAEIAKTEAEAMLAASKARTEDQLRQSVGRDVPEITHQMLPKRRTFYPEATSHRAARPLYIPVRDPDSGRDIRLFNPELGLDEIGQVLGVANITEARARSTVQSAWDRYVQFGKAGGDKVRGFWSWFKRNYGTQSQRRK
jgi:hypothetical protein